MREVGSGDLALEICDDGPGINPENQAHLFEPFFTTDAQGTGLGLPLVKHIVEDVHGGRIEVASELGRGSTFRVILPGLAQLNA